MKNYESERVDYAVDRLLETLEKLEDEGFTPLETIIALSICQAIGSLGCKEIEDPVELFRATLDVIKKKSHDEPESNHRTLTLPPP